MKNWFMAAFMFLAPLTLWAAPPQTFEQAKVLSKQYVYHDRNNQGDLYCNCPWTWAGRSGGVMRLDECGYAIRAQANRAQRMEWEHIVPASTFGRQRQCWQNGGRSNCNQTDPVFNVMEADMFNLYPSVGEVNGDRSNFNVGMAPNTTSQYGQCPVKIDFQQRIAEPPAYAKGLVARVHFYMADRYNLRFSDQQERVLIAWDRAFPVTQWELERDRRIARVMGHHNPFVIKEKVWVQGYRPAANVPPPQPTRAPQAPQSVRSAPQATTVIPGVTPVQTPQPVAAPAQAQTAPVLGNRNSKIYHIQGRCPNYADVSPQNQVAFQNEQQAQSAGFRRAGNCR